MSQYIEEKILYFASVTADMQTGKDIVKIISETAKESVFTFEYILEYAKFLIAGGYCKADELKSKLTNILDQITQSGMHLTYTGREEFKKAFFHLISISD